MGHFITFNAETQGCRLSQIKRTRVSVLNEPRSRRIRGTVFAVANKMKRSDVDLGATVANKVRQVRKGLNWFEQLKVDDREAART